VAAELADPERATWVAARPDGALLGYAQVGPGKLPHADVRKGAGELYQIYVAGAAQGTGIGRRLLDIALDHLAVTRPGPVWLGVWEGNLRAQAVYAARGFRQVGSYCFMVGDWEDRDLIWRRD
jgi:ribosomal protein S18 acetylase RimI-like enzyme